MLCPKCGNDNPPDYRFCGMCGTPLEKSASEPARAARPVQPSGGSRERVPAPPQTLSGPSFLGLGQEPPPRDYGDSSRDVSYLFEEEQPRRTYWRFMLVLIILLACAGLGWLEYTRSGKSWTPPWSKGPAQSPVQASQQPQQEPTQQAPAANQPDNSAASKTEAPPAPTATAPAQPAAPPAASSDNQASTTKETANPNQPGADNSQPSKSEPAATGPAASSENENTAEESNTAEPAKPVKAAKLAKPKPRPTPTSSPDDALVANAEKYLYGRGVPQNCDRALSSLRPAADRANTRARTLLGTMYATGHCVPRDLPNAYRWFALASRESPDNTWVQRNLEMIWREMTPQERQLAMQKSQ